MNRRTFGAIFSETVHEILDKYPVQLTIAADAAQLTGTPLVFVNEVVIRRTPDRVQLDSLVKLALAK